MPEDRFQVRGFNDMLERVKTHAMQATLAAISQLQRPNIDDCPTATGFLTRTPSSESTHYLSPTSAFKEK